MEYKSSAYRIKSADESKGEATIIVSVFNTPDEIKDIVVPGAFQRSLKTRVPKFIADHDWSILSKLGKFTAARETDEGLELDSKFNLAKQVAKDVFSDFLFDPDGTEFSFGYGVPDGGAEVKEGFRYLKDLDLYEAGPVLMGMHPDTRLVGAKNSFSINFPNVPNLGAPYIDGTSTSGITVTTDSTTQPGTPGADSASGESSTEEKEPDPKDVELVAFADEALDALREVLSR